ncbi:DUF1259 domain-containing protein [Armatimonas sp.]|uniref:DUF1259 domain-containing protein n=1 Tax=Armatimonas sp. TaxID=1872638 RepID=UPI0037519098
MQLTRRNILTTVGLGIAAYPAAALAKPTKMLTPEEISAIETAFGKKGRSVENEALYTIPLPRNDLKITIQGEPIPIPFGFGGWVSFKRTRDGKQLMVMSDTVLLQHEVAGVMDGAIANGLEIAAVHNHFFYEEPRVFYMHLHGMGTDAGELARRYLAAIQPSPLHPANQPKPNPGATPPIPAFDIPALDALVGYKATPNGATIKYTVGRADLTIMDMNVEMTAAIGLNSWASFAGTMEKAHIAGDIAMLEREVNLVIPILRKAGLEVVALHHHMLFESPKMIFLHYFGTGPALQLAEGFKAALSTLGKKPGRQPMRHR